MRESEDGDLGKMNVKELWSLLRHGAEHIMRSVSPSAQESDIDKLLSNAEKRCVCVCVSVCVCLLVLVFVRGFNDASTAACAL